MIIFIISLDRQNYSLSYDIQYVNVNTVHTEKERAAQNTPYQQLSILNVWLRDMISIKRMHDCANLLSLDQRRQKQVLILLFIYNDRCTGIRRIHARNTRAANVYSFVSERYHNVKYKNSPYYKGSLLWDTLPVMTKTLPKYQ